MCEDCKETKKSLYDYLYINVVDDKNSGTFKKMKYGELKENFLKFTKDILYSTLKQHMGYRFSHKLMNRIRSIIEFKLSLYLQSLLLDGADDFVEYYVRIYDKIYLSIEIRYKLENTFDHLFADYMPIDQCFSIRDGNKKWWEVVQLCCNQEQIELDEKEIKDVITEESLGEITEEEEVEIDIEEEEGEKQQAGDGLTEVEDHLVNLPIITFSQYQRDAHELAVYPQNVSMRFVNEHIAGMNRIDWVYPALGMANEAGEVLGKLKKVMRDKDGFIVDETRDELSKEVGDVLWYIAELCTTLGLDLETVAKRNIDKLKERKERGTIKGNGDNR